ncbi:hypothetical protein RvY_07550 [Ramazzottius varieornatus]|uniref:Uncharacterized protein n=1 Tax=Ramazzottius varieornatus TaxID=947166 RepID=A0A1D1V2K8_RAMVA|nr:hypothetical protein RvY_07550 [Ramazzottius varieornatus]
MLLIHLVMAFCWAYTFAQDGNPDLPIDLGSLAPLNLGISGEFSSNATANDTNAEGKNGSSPNYLYCSVYTDPVERV